MPSLTRDRKFHIICFEGLGSLILTYGICSSATHVAPDFIIASALFLAICQSGQITGGYINPLVTIGTYIDRRHRKLLLYLAAQLLGSLLGAFLSWGLLGSVDPPYQEGWDSIELPKFLLNQLIGSALFTICVLTLTNRYTSHASKSWQIYLSVPVALYLVRKMTGSTVLNPGVGISLQLVAACAQGDAVIFWRDVWPLVIPSLLGAIIGGYFMTKLYEPLLLYIRYKDLSDEEIEDHNQERE